MLDTRILNELLDWLSDLLGTDYRTAQARPSGAGCINETYEIYSQQLDSVFVKVGPVGQLDMYEKEALGLQLLDQCPAIRVPAVLGAARLQHCSVLAMEFIALAAIKARHEAHFGEALAQLHSMQGKAYGLEHNNYIGRSHQINGWHTDWWVFYAERRLLPQRKLAQAKGMRRALLQDLDRLLGLLPHTLGWYQPPAVLLHGDLWSGNMAVDPSGTPTLFDPAVYYGDAETDLAMSRMFGAPGAAFYEAYHTVLPLRDGHSLRRNLYDLYHWLNHFNLFGVGYLGQVEHTLAALLRELS